jgi:hypothetical protein
MTVWPAASLVPQISLHASLRFVKIKGMEANRREQTNRELDPPRSVGQAQMWFTSPIFQPRSLNARGYPCPTRVHDYITTTLRSLRGLGTRTQLSLRVPYVPYAEAMRQPVAPDHRPSPTKHILFRL